MLVNGGIVEQFSRCGMASSFLSSDIIGLNILAFQLNLEGQLSNLEALQGWGSLGWSA